MIVGDVPEVDGEFQLKCAYPGCGNKKMQVDISIGPFRRRVNFIGVTAPGFEDPPQTAASGRDLPTSTVLRVRWERLTFNGEDPILGPVQIDMITQPSTGRVYSLANPSRGDFGDWLIEGTESAANTFFPAVNENRLYFTIHIPRFGIRMRNSEPVDNGAVIDAIPPKGINYRLKRPVSIRGPRLLPVRASLENCRMAMTILSAVDLEVIDFQASGDLQARLRVKALNLSDVERVRLAASFHSSAGIELVPSQQFVQVGRDPVDLEFHLDARSANPPGFIMIGIVLIDPYESPGAAQMLIDYDEIRLGRLDDRAPDFSSGSYARSPLRDQ